MDTSAGHAVCSTLQSLDRQLPRLHAMREGGELYGAPRLNPFDLFNLNETTLSRAVADLLDPKGTHGQGDLFLVRVLGGLGLPKSELGSFARVRREMPTPENRRIDIVVDTPNILLGIENKPWAAQLPKQLSDYWAALERWAEGKPVALIFLSQQRPATAADNVHRLPFTSLDGEFSLKDALVDALPHVRAERTKVHVQDFVDYLDSQFGDGKLLADGDMPYINAVRAEFAKPEGRCGVAAIMLSSQIIHSEILEEIASSVLAGVREYVPDAAMVGGESIYARLEGSNDSWRIRSETWPPNVWLSLCSGGGRFRRMYAGVQAPTDAHVEVGSSVSRGYDRARLIKDLASIPGGRSTDWYTWFEWLEPSVWDERFAARLVIESFGKVSEHPTVTALVDRFQALAQSVSRSLASDR